jgi:uracil-DNA glycosylase family 4
MNKQIRDGLIDYLTVMQYAGLTDVGNFPVEIADKLPNVETQTISVTKNNAAEIPPASILPDLTEPDKLNDEIKSTTTNIVNNSTMEPEIKNVYVEHNSTEDVDDDKLSQLKLLAEEVAACSRCPQLAQSRTQTVFGTGNPYSRLLFLGEAPGADEDIKGEPFVGRSGKLLDDIITKGMKIKREDVYICNILRCRPPGNRTPEPDEAANCSTFLEKTIKIVNPKFICCLGSVATRHLMKTEKSIGQMRKSVHNYNGIKVICTYHPSYLLRMPAAKKDTWEDIKLLMKVMETDEC